MIAAVLCAVYIVHVHRVSVHVHHHQPQTIRIMFIACMYVVKTNHFLH